MWRCRGGTVGKWNCVSPGEDCPGSLLAAWLMVFTGDKNAVRTRSSPLAAQRRRLQARVVRLEMIPISFVLAACRVRQVRADAPFHECRCVVEYSTHPTGLAVSVLAIVHSIPLINHLDCAVRSFAGSRGVRRDFSSCPARCRPGSTRRPGQDQPRERSDRPPGAAPARLQGPGGTSSPPPRCSRSRSSGPGRTS